MKAYHQGQLDFFCAIYAYVNALKLCCGISLTQARHVLGVALDEVSRHPKLWDALLHNDTDHYWLVDYLLGRFSSEVAYCMKAGRIPVVPPVKAWSGDRDGIRELSGLEVPERLNLVEIEAQLGVAAPASFRTPGVSNSDTPVEDARQFWNLGRLWPVLKAWLPERPGLWFGLSRKKSVESRPCCLLLRFHRYLPGQLYPFISHWSTGMEFRGDTLGLFDCTANKGAVHALPRKEVAVRLSDISPETPLGLEPESIYFLERA